MKGFRYLGLTTLSFDAAKCNGCRLCQTVCPHAVFAAVDGRVRIADRDACMECGACARNCRPGAIRVNAGVGCASAIILSWLRRRETVSCG